MATILLLATAALVAAVTVDLARRPTDGQRNAWLRAGIPITGLTAIPADGRFAPGLPMAATAGWEKGLMDGRP